MQINNEKKEINISKCLNVACISRWKIYATKLTNVKKWKDTPKNSVFWVNNNRSMFSSLVGVLFVSFSSFSLDWKQKSIRYMRFLLRVHYNLQCQFGFIFYLPARLPCLLWNMRVQFALMMIIWSPQAKLYCFNVSFKYMKWLNYTRILFKSAHTKKASNIAKRNKKDNTIPIESKKTYKQTHMHPKC